MTTGSKLLDYSKLHLFGIELAFIELGNYLTVIENFLETERIRLEKDFNENDIAQKAKEKYEFESEYYNHLLSEFSERHWELNILYPHNFRASILTQIISFIEFELKKICDHHQVTAKQVFGISDLKGNSDIEKCKKYLSKICNVNFSSLEPEWNFIDNSRVVRNKIIHHQGIFLTTYNDFKKVSEFVRKENGIGFKEDKLNTRHKSLTECTLLIENKSFCENLLSQTESFFKKLLNNQLKYIS